MVHMMRKRQGHFAFPGARTQGTIRGNRRLKSVHRKIAVYLAEYLQRDLSHSLRIFWTRRGEYIEIEHGLIADNFRMMHDVWRNHGQAPGPEAHHLVTDMEIDRTGEDVDDLFVDMAVRLGLMAWMQAMQRNRSARAGKSLTFDALTHRGPFDRIPINAVYVHGLVLSVSIWRKGYSSRRRCAAAWLSCRAPAIIRLWSEPQMKTDMPMLA